MSAISKDVSVLLKLLIERRERKVPKGDFSEDTWEHPMWKSIIRKTLHWKSVSDRMLQLMRWSASLHFTVVLSNYKQRQKKWQQKCRCHKSFFFFFLIHHLDKSIGYVLSEGLRSQMASSSHNVNMHLSTITEINRVHWFPPHRQIILFRISLAGLIADLSLVLSFSSKHIFDCLRVQFPV